MARKIERRVDRGLEGADREDLHKYLDWLRESLNAAAAIVRRSVTFMLLLMVIFQLIQEQGNSEIALGPLKITRIETILYFFPTLIAYFYLEVIVYSTRYDDLTAAFAVAFKKWRDVAEENDLDQLVIPWLPIYWNIVGKDFDEKHSPAYAKVEYKISAVLALGSVTGALAFQVYAFYRLFDIYSYSAPLLWVNLIFSLGLIIAAIIHFGTLDELPSNP